LARDPSGQLFLLDLSAAAEAGTTWMAGADELWRIDRFFQQAGFSRLLAFRQIAYGIVAPCRFSLEHRGYRHVYTCSVQAAAEALDDALYISSEQAAAYWREEKRTQRLEDALRFSPGWLVAPQPLAPDLCAQFRLIWGWSPLKHRR
jgi:hypothetical protein